MDRHREIAERVGAALAERDDVLAVLIAGSVGRGEHVATSDVDLLVVTTEDSSLEVAPRRLVDGLLVEWIARPEPDWLARFDRPKTSWLYSFLEAEVLMDSGPAGRLVKAARDVLDSYRTSAELRRLLATTLWHGQAKLDRAQAAGQPRELGYWAALCVESVLDGLYAARDVPLPAGARRLAYLHLVPLTEDEDALIETMLTASPAGRFEATRFLMAQLRSELGPADHERTSGAARLPAGELRQELFALAGTETADAALSRDPGALHDRSGAGLADARQRAYDLGDLRLAGEVIIAAQHIGEREGACFQVGQQGRSGGARLTSLLQRGLALLGGQDRECHEGFLSVSRAGTAASWMSRPSWRAMATVRDGAGPPSPDDPDGRLPERSQMR